MRKVDNKYYAKSIKEKLNGKNILIDSISEREVIKILNFFTNNILTTFTKKKNVYLNKYGVFYKPHIKNYHNGLNNATYKQLLNGYS